MAACGPEPPQAAAKRFCEVGWGGYIALWAGTEPGSPVTFRDPTGAIESLLWRRGRLGFAASSLAAPGIADLLPGMSVAWDRVARGLIDTAAFGGGCALTGLEAAAPGEFVELRSSGAQRRQLWTPAAALGSSRIEVFRDADPTSARVLLSATIDRCTRAYGKLGGRVLAEVSGGLDSGIMASSLRRAPGVEVSRWLNIHPADAAGDERPYARAVADRLGVSLTELAKPDIALDLDAIEALSRSARPSFNGMDPEYDATIADQGHSADAWAVWTGQGGDEVFFASRSPLIAAEIVDGRGWRSLFDPRLRSLAQWTRTSVWSLLEAARVPPRREAFAVRLPFAADALLHSELHNDHPWLKDLDGLSPAKWEQVAFLAHALLYRTPCARTDRLRLIHGPLLQPIVEACLALPAAMLTGCRRDRALVRDAFASRLPACVITRRSKGDLTAYYGRMLARSLHKLEAYLLEGVLMSEGLLDLERLRTALNVEALCWRGGYADLMDLTAIEAWARFWSHRSAIAPSSLLPE